MTERTGHRTPNTSGTWIAHPYHEAKYDTCLACQAPADHPVHKMPNDGDGWTEDIDDNGYLLAVTNRSPILKITGRTILRHPDSPNGWLVIEPEDRQRTDMTPQPGDRFAWPNLPDQPATVRTIDGDRFTWTHDTDPDTPYRARISAYPQ